MSSGDRKTSFAASSWSMGENFTDGIFGFWEIDLPVARIFQTCVYPRKRSFFGPLKRVAQV